MKLYTDPKIRKYIGLEQKFITSSLRRVIAPSINQPNYYQQSW